MSFSVSFSYGVLSGPLIVAVQFRRLVADGKALMPGGGESIRVISSDWRLHYVRSIL